MAFAVTRIAASCVALLASQNDAAAHALAQRYDLPLPLHFYLLAAGAAVAVTFIILAFVHRPKAVALGAWHDRILARGTIPGLAVTAAQTVSVATLLLIVAAGLFGHQNPFKNIAPVGVWVIWWVGLALLSAFVGNFWLLLNPWAALFGFAEWLVLRSSGRRLSLRLPYPARLGAWPACALLLLFAWFELVAPGRDVPRNIAIVSAVYSGLTWTGFAAFGRDIWLKHGEVFSIAFGLFGRFAPLHLAGNRRWHWSVRPYAFGLLTREPLDASLTAFALLMLGTVSVDGLMETPLWAAVVEQALARGDAASSTIHAVLASILLVAGPLALAALYLAVIALMPVTPRAPGIAALAGYFVLSLVPIAIAYHLAHYFSLLMIAGQFIIPLASDPFGHGWDLFGTTLYRIDIGIVDARFIWYLSVIAIVTGHIIAVWLAHATAFAVYGDPTMARRSQYPMLALMIGYTMLSLWILAQPIVEAASPASK